MPGFGARIRPDQVTFTMRCRLARSVYHREFIALAAVFGPCFLVTVAVAAFYYAHVEAAGTVWQLIGPVIVTGALIGLGIHTWGFRERRFVENAPVARAVVKEIETSCNGTYKHRVMLSYRPMQDRATKATIPVLRAAQVVIASVESDLPGFSQKLQKGDTVSILYDPAEPDHVCIIEEEQAAEIVHPSAA